LDILRSREQVLASAFASREISTRVAALNIVDVNKFIEANPAKFSDQKIFSIDQVSLRLIPALNPSWDR